MNKTSFGTTKAGCDASVYELSNQKRLRVLVTDYGATVISIFVKDKNDKERDVILGYDDLASYERETCYFGATIGRNANRIADAKVTIDGTEYKLEANDNENSLHSGSNGVNGKMWKVVNYADDQITFSIVSKDLEQGFPGNCDIQVTYQVTDQDELKITYHAVSDKKTVINMTNHSYFNLAGQENGDVLAQTLKIHASHYTPMIDSKAIPTGEIASVEGTPFDFRIEKPIGQNIKDQNEQLIYANGYDHNFAVDKTKDGIEKIASAYCKESGIRMDVLTDLPGVQLYTANFVGGQHGKRGVVYVQNAAFCLETQYYPNAVNEPNFASPIFDAGEAYDTTTVYAFSIEK